MRFRFADYAGPREQADRDAVLARIDAWWKSFASHAQQIDRHFTQGEAFEIPDFTGHALTSR